MTKVRWKSESELCQSLIDACRAQGWACYAETFGFDILLVSPAGTRLGIEAKLQPNAKVIDQAREHTRRNKKAAHYVVVVVPHAAPRFYQACNALNIGVLVLEPGVAQVDILKGLSLATDCVARSTVTLKPLPAVCVDMPAGVPSPRSITPWKLAAVRFCMDHLGSDAITAAMFVAAGLDHRRWVKSKWLVPTSKIVGASGRLVQAYKLGPAPGRPDLKFPEIVAAYLALTKKAA